MRKKISVIGKGVQIAPELSRAADIADEVRGADVVVLASDGDLDEIGRSAPAATIVLTGDDLEARCKSAYEALLVPRSRIVGVPDPGHVSDVLAAILFEHDDPHEVIALKDGNFTACSDRLGHRGIS